MGEKATDEEVAKFFEKHIGEPCGTEAGDLEEFYKREAERVKKTFTDEEARKRLEEAIKRGKKNK